MFQVIELVGLVLTIGALILARIQYHDSKKQEESLRGIAEAIAEQSGRMARVAQNISTQAVGKFPTNMDAIIRLVENTKEELRVMSDAGAYGHFSNHPKFQDYQLALQRLRDSGGVVRLILYADGAYKEATEAQFKETEFEKLKTLDPSYRDFFERYHRGIPKPENYREFIDILMRQEMKFRQESSDKGIELLTVPRIPDLPFFLWWRDDYEAIISFYNLGKDVTEIAFVTTDGSLVNALGKTFEGIVEKIKERGAAVSLTH